MHEVDEHSLIREKPRAGDKPYFAMKLALKAR
jgi:hypothetical protein